MLSEKELQTIIDKNQESAELGCAKSQGLVILAQEQLDKIANELTDWEKKILKQLAPVRKAWDNGLFDSPEEARWRSEERNWGVESEDA